MSEGRPDAEQLTRSFPEVLVTLLNRADERSVGVVDDNAVTSDSVARLAPSATRSTAH